MSRVGKLPVQIPAGVKCEVQGTQVSITGPKGTLAADFSPEMGIALENAAVVVTRPSDKKEHRALHGLTRALINNMVIGVTKGFERTLLITGVGYRASLQGMSLNLALGYSHPVTVAPPEGITFTLDGQQTIRIAGIDKQQVGQVAANIRALRKPEPYKGKGIRYDTERIRRKVGKAGSK
ncbi:MAG: 50S ribosomal protein L6 [Candidatus Hydrogenedentes bacterium]|nr:50S ribosomal protein L6 [Candidatus Hydrogenedentota bacterium]MBI3118032.1 50S ribosomal protein L6 [Candidatus Hydrogenedentota bacterium]